MLLNNMFDVGVRCSLLTSGLLIHTHTHTYCEYMKMSSIANVVRSRSNLSTNFVIACSLSLVHEQRAHATCALGPAVATGWRLERGLCPQ